MDTPSGSPQTDDLLAQGLGSLSAALWDQRAQLHELAHRAKVAQLVMAGDDGRWLARAVAELDDAVREVRADDHVPARLLGAIGRHLGLQAPVTLRDLSAQLPDPWSATILEHAEGLDVMLTRLGAIERENRQLAIGGLGNIRALLAVIHGDEEIIMDAGYDRDGRAVHVDESRLERLM